jgi:hypothetical protein
MDFTKLNHRFIRHVNMPSNLGTIDAPTGRALGVGHCRDSIEVTLTDHSTIGEERPDAHI